MNDGNKIPALGFGTYKATEEEGRESVKRALREGYCLIDTAARYNNETAVGKGLKDSGVPREEIFLTTKVWRDQMGYKNTIEAFSESLSKLGLDYIDLYLIHWPANAKNFENWQEVNAQTWRAMEELQMDGKVKSIGVSNFWPEHLGALFQTARVLPVVNQIEFHPGYWQPAVTSFCKRHHIVVEAWSPLARGKVFGNDVLQSLAGKYGKSVSQVCLRWVVQHGAIPIPKSTTTARIEENLQIFDFQLTETDMRQIDAIPKMGFSGELPNNWPDVEEE